MATVIDKPPTVTKPSLKATAKGRFDEACQAIVLHVLQLVADGRVLNDDGATLLDLIERRNSKAVAVGAGSTLIDEKAAMPIYVDMQKAIKLLPQAE